MQAPFANARQETIDALRQGLYAARICGYAQGMALIRQGADRYGWQINLAEIGRIWKGGCIIRARLLDPVRQAFGNNPALVNLLIDPAIAEMMRSAQAGWRRVVARAAQAGIPMPAHGACARILRHLPHRAPAAEPHAGAARRLRRAQVRTDRSARGRAQRMVTSTCDVLTCHVARST